MQVSTDRPSVGSDLNFENVKTATIQFGEVRYRISDNKEGGLCINKYDPEDGSEIQITPRVGNEIYVK